MKVSQLQQLLRGVVDFAKESGAAAKVVGDLDQAVRCLDPFASHSVEQWSTFLAAADEYHRTGKLPLPPLEAPKKGRGGKAAGAPKVVVPKLRGPEGIKTAIERFNLMYEKANRRELTHEYADQELAWFNAALDKATAIMVAVALEIPKPDSKDGALQAMKHKAFSRMESAGDRDF